MLKQFGCLVLALGLMGFGCVLEDDGDKPDDPTASGKEDRWNWENDPARFQVQMNYKMAELPRTGSAERPPWSETWWPMRKDGFNQRWQGTTVLSPLEKYDQAFNGWTPSAAFLALRPFSYPGSAFDTGYYDQLGPAAKWESQNGGNQQARNGRDDDGDGQTDEAADWDGLGGWWGKCHMWSAVAVLADEPQRAVTLNGVTFETSDITGLVMETFFNKSRSYMLGGRCNDEEVARDANGRATNVACRDTNAGSFHVVVANMLGVHRRSFVMDKSSDIQVWNHPVSDFNVALAEEVNLARTLELLGLPAGDVYPYNPDAKTFWHVRTELGFITDGVSPSRTPHGPVRDSDTYEYILELDAQGSIIGGEWIGDTGPDFFWLPVMNTYSRGGNPSVKLAEIENILRLATGTVTPPPPTGDQVTVPATVATPLAIPDDNATGITSGLDVTGTDTASAVKVAVRITHTFIGDLSIELRHGDKTVNVYSGAGGSADNLNQEFSLPDFQGAAVSGRWELLVKDTAGQDTGTLDGWSLIYTPGAGGTPTPNRRTVTGAATARADIPDNNTTGVTSRISIADSGLVRALTVSVNIQHTYIGDLKVQLRHGGTTIVLHNNAGGSQDNLVRDFTVADFASTNVTGAWELIVVDNARQDKGYIQSWSISATVE